MGCKYGARDHKGAARLPEPSFPTRLDKLCETPAAVRLTFVKGMRMLP